jgi:tRNA dimethylallyltransferase
VRQERWFRRDPRIKWVSISQDPVSEIVPIVAKHLR